MNFQNKHISVVPGDGIGQEVVDAVLDILQAASAPVTWTICYAGESIFKQGISSGVPNETIESINKTKVVLKGPLTTPVGYGERSANVYLRKKYELFANIRPVKQYPNIPSLFSDVPIDLVVVRENLEDLYAGIEYNHLPTIAQSIKLISRYGCDTINTFAFEYAKQTGRKSIHCATKANILKTTEGMMKQSFEFISKYYPDICPHHIIIDNCAHQLVINPDKFDMIVTTNMNGDIISDLTSGLVGGLGIAPSANIGNDVAIFEAVHGAAPDIAGQGKANPTAMLMSAIMMLRYLDFDDVANAIEHALAVTLLDGKMTGDLVDSNPLSTNEFSQAIINNLGKKAKSFKLSSFKPFKMPKIKHLEINLGSCYGVDFIIISDKLFSNISGVLNQFSEKYGFKQVRLFNRGREIHSDGSKQLIPQWLCRFESHNLRCRDSTITGLAKDIAAHFHWVLSEKLFSFD